MSISHVQVPMKNAIWNVEKEIKYFSMHEKDPSSGTFRYKGRIASLEASKELCTVVITLADGTKGKYSLQKLSKDNKLFQGIQASRTKFLEKWRDLNDTKNNDCSVMRGEFNISSKLIGQCVKVHVNNLSEPASSRKLRKADTNHVNELKAYFKERPEISLILCCNIKVDKELEQIDVNRLHENGYAKIETLGGNHTRIALQQLLQENCTVPEHVFANIYSDLSDSEALKLGYNHNLNNELGRPTSADELMLLFRMEYEKVFLQNPNMNHIKINQIWKGNLCAILGVSKKTSHNVYHCMISIVQCSSETWEQVKIFMDLWRKGEIGNMPKKADVLKKMHFAKMSCIKEDGILQDLLKRLVRNELDWKEFNLICSTHSRRNKVQKADEKVGKDTVPEENEICDGDYDNDVGATENEEIEKRKDNVETAENKEQRIKTLEAALEQKKKTIERMEKEFNLKIEKQNTEAEDRYQRISDENNRLKQELSRLKSISDENNKLKQENSRLKRVERETEETIKRNDSLMHQVKTMQFEMDELRHKCNAVEKSLPVEINSEQSIGSEIELVTLKRKHPVIKVGITKKKKNDNPESCQRTESEEKETNAVIDRKKNKRNPESSQRTESEEKETNAVIDRKKNKRNPESSQRTESEEKETNAVIDRKKNKRNPESSQRTESKEKETNAVIDRKKNKRGTFKVGDAVFAIWQEDGFRYPATILQVNRSSFRVKFYDNIDADVAKETVQHYSESC